MMLPGDIIPLIGMRIFCISGAKKLEPLFGNLQEFRKIEKHSEILCALSFRQGFLFPAFFGQYYRSASPLLMKIKYQG